MVNCTCYGSMGMVFQGRAWISAWQGPLRRRTAPSLPSGHTRRTRHLYKSVTCNPYAESPHKETCTCKNQKHTKVAHFATPMAHRCCILVQGSWVCTPVTQHLVWEPIISCSAPATQSIQLRVHNWFDPRVCGMEVV